MNRALVATGAITIVVLAAVTFAWFHRSSGLDGPENEDNPRQELSPRADVNGGPRDAVDGSRTTTSPVLIETRHGDLQARRDQELLSAEKDGWKTEFFAELAANHLKQVFKTASASGRFDSAKVAANSVAACDLPPGHLESAYRDEFISVQRQTRSQAQKESLTPAMLDERLAKLIPYEQLVGLHYHVKIISINLLDSTIDTRALIELSHHDDETSWQANFAWDCQWQTNGQRQMRLCSIQTDSYSDSVVSCGSNRWFTDRTMGVLPDDKRLREQLFHGHHYWLQRIERSHRFDTSVRNGLAIGDANGDGLDDVYVCQPPGLPNLLLVHLPDGRTIEQGAKSGLDWLDQTSSAVFADLDNDGDQDLLIGTPTGTLVMSNDSTGQFELAATLSHDYDIQSISVVDYDQDGLLDVFLCLYRTASPPADQFFLYRDAVGGGKNRLFRNTTADRKLAFEDVTARVGLEDGSTRYTLAASWEDFDNDGDQDLYVANDFGKNYLYRNDSGKFVNVAPQAGVEDIGSGMSVSWGDYNQDGWIDLYVGNMFSSAGSRVTQQKEFRSEEDEAIRGIYQRLAKGNSLFRNNGDGTFSEVGTEAGVELGRWAWSSLFGDFNNDGWNDLFVANGYITTPDTGDL